MGTNAKDNFDPRFDPAFQPGFDGGVVAVPSARKTRDTTPAQAALTQRAAAAERADPAPASSDEVEDAPEHRRRPNPFLLVLIAISIALIAGGLSAVQSVRALFDTENISVELDYISLEMIKIAAPLTVALGVTTAIGVLFVYAVDWKKRHDS
jgi:hypothetical protein